MIRASGSEAIYVKTDVNNEAECMAMAKAAFDHFGAINILINNAAIFESIILKPFNELSSKEFKLDELQIPGRCIRRPGVPEDLIGTALFLATDDSAFITGQMIVHDGGLSFH